MKIMVDVDNTICFYKNINQKHAKINKVNYIDAVPYKERIVKINKLYEEGNEIIYWTARGSRTGINWFNITLKQLNDWGAKFTELKLGKPHYDLFIDDKNINSDSFFKNN